MVRILICMSTVLFLFSSGLFGVTLDEARFNLASKYLDQKRYQEAAQEYSELVSKYPFSPYYSRSLTALGKSLFALGNYETALSYYEQAVKKEANPMEKRKALFGRAECNYNLKRYQISGPQFQSFAISFPDSPACPAALYYGGMSFEALKQTQEALLFYKTLETQFPQSQYSAMAKKRENIIAEKQKQKEKEAIVAVFTGKEPVETETVISTFTITNEKIEKEMAKPYYLTNLLTVTVTNTSTPAVFTNYFYNTNETYIVRTNLFMLTNYFVYTNQSEREILVSISNIVTNQLIVTQTVVQNIENREPIIEPLVDENRKKEEEVSRYQALLELKAKLLEMKEKMIQDKNSLLLNDQKTN